MGCLYDIYIEFLAYRVLQIYIINLCDVYSYNKSALVLGHIDFYKVYIGGIPCIFYIDIFYILVP